MQGLENADIWILAGIAAFLVFRLRSILGKRTGHEEQQRPTPFARPRSNENGGDTRQDGQRDPTGRDNVVQLPPRDERSADAAPSAAPGLAQLKAADRRFDEVEFAQGARAAFGLIVEAYAKGDLEALRRFLNDELYDQFSEAVDARTRANEVLETRIEQLDVAEVVEARLEGSIAYVTLRFESRQSNVTRDENGAVVDGDPNEVVPVIDLWTFARDTQSSDPNWTLVATATPN